MAYVMLTGISPFLGENKQETFLNISQLNVSYSEEELQQLDQAALSFIQMLLRKQPQSVHFSLYLNYMVNLGKWLAVMYYPIWRLKKKNEVSICTWVSNTAVCLNLTSDQM